MSVSGVKIDRNQWNNLLTSIKGGSKKCVSLPELTTRTQRLRIKSWNLSFGFSQRSQSVSQPVSRSVGIFCNFHQLSVPIQCCTNHQKVLAALMNRPPRMNVHSFPHPRKHRFLLLYIRTIIIIIAWLDVRCVYAGAIKTLLHNL